VHGECSVLLIWVQPDYMVDLALDEAAIKAFLAALPHAPHIRSGS
jgi:hypothetical protein